MKSGIAVCMGGGGGIKPIMMMMVVVVVVVVVYTESDLERQMVTEAIEKVETSLRKCKVEQPGGGGGGD